MVLDIEDMLVATLQHVKCSFSDLHIEVVG